MSVAPCEGCSTVKVKRPKVGERPAMEPCGATRVMELQRIHVICVCPRSGQCHKEVWQPVKATAYNFLTIAHHYRRYTNNLGLLPGFQEDGWPSCRERCNPISCQGKMTLTVSIVLEHFGCCQS